MRLPGASQRGVRNVTRRLRRAARIRAARGTARRRASSSMRRVDFVVAREEEEKRYPTVPVQAVALEPEQQGGTGPDI